MSIEAMKMALETLERLDRWLALRYGNELTPPEREVVTALRQAIEQEEDAVLAEREACAKICERRSQNYEYQPAYQDKEIEARHCAEDIRNRSEK